MNIDHPLEQRFVAPEREPVNNASFPQPVGLSSRLATKYLWLSLLVALIPLVGFVSLYDTYFSQLVTRLTEERLATRIAATQNEFRAFIRERSFELEALAHEFDDPNTFTPKGRQAISEELENLLRQQMDARSIYGVVFFDRKGEVAWTFPESQAMDLVSLPKMDSLEKARLIGPLPYSIEHPAKLVLRQSVVFNRYSEQLVGIGLIVRFNSLTNILRGLDQGNAFRVLLQAGDGNIYDVVGQPVDIMEASTQQFTLLPNWTLHVIQDRELVMSPAEKMRYWLSFGVCFTVVGLLWLHMSISRRLNQQVDGLINRVEDVAQGNLEAPVTAIRGMEMLRLTQSIERMRLQLKAFIQSSLESERQMTLAQLAVGLAHDIRNPLATIRTTIAALSKKEKNSENKEMITLVEEEIDRVNEVLEHLLNFARPQAPNASRIEVAELLNSLEALMAASARNHKITLNIQCQEELFLWADEGHVRQILMNIVLNAVEAMSVKGSMIQLKASQQHDGIVLSISDDGPGIPEERRNHIMEPFFTTKPAGTGLGLAICQALVKSNKGKITIESSEGKGTTVVVLLPKIQR